MWRKYFKLKGILPGRVVTHNHGTIDFSRDDLSIETLKELYETNFEYLELTTEGLMEFYGASEETQNIQDPEIPDTDTISVPVMDENSFDIPSETESTAKPTASRKKTKPQKASK